MTYQLAVTIVPALLLIAILTSLGKDTNGVRFGARARVAPAAT